MQTIKKPMWSNKVKNTIYKNIFNIFSNKLQGNRSEDIQNKLITKFELKFPIDKDNLVILATKLLLKKLLLKNNY